jgi:hypothetical protein
MLRPARAGGPMAKKARKKSKKKSKAKSVKRGKPPRTKKRVNKPAKKSARAKRQSAKGASAFQIMIDTINETERLRTKNERRDVTDETG